jgi:hypothetical protein
MADGDEFKIAVIEDASDFIAYLDLEYTTAGGYKIRLYTRNDLAGYNSSGLSSTAAGSGPVTILARWKASSAAGADDGAMQWYEDGVYKNQLTGIDNDTMTQDVGTSGDILFKDIRWWEDEYIASTHYPTVTATENVFIDVPVGTLALTGHVPTVTTTENVTVDVPLATLTLTGLVPTVVGISGVEVDVPVGTLTLTGYAPTVTVTAHVEIDVPTGTLVLTGHVPTVETPRDVDVPLGTLVLTGYAPTVVATDEVLIYPPAAELILTGYAPTVVGVGDELLGLDKPERKPTEYEKQLLDLPPIERKPSHLFAMRQQQKERLASEAAAENLRRQNEAEAARRVEALLASEKAAQDKADRRRAASLHNLAKAQIAKEAKAERQAEINKQRAKNLKKARAAKKRKAKKKKK